MFDKLAMRICLVSLNSIIACLIVLSSSSNLLYTASSDHSLRNGIYKATESKDRKRLGKNLAEIRESGLHSASVARSRRNRRLRILHRVRGCVRWIQIALRSNPTRSSILFHTEARDRDDPRSISRTLGSRPKSPHRPSIRAICGGEQRRGGRRRRRWAQIGRRKPKTRGSETKGPRVWKGIDRRRPRKNPIFFFPSLSLPFFVAYYIHRHSSAYRSVFARENGGAPCIVRTTANTAHRIQPMK